MNIFDEKRYLKISGPDMGEDRIIVKLFPIKGGLCFFDIGWIYASTNPIHFIKGKIEGEGPWTIGSAKIEVIKEGTEIYNKVLAWQKYRDDELPNKDRERELFEWEVTFSKGFTDQIDFIEGWEVLK